MRGGVEMAMTYYEFQVPYVAEFVDRYPVPQRFWSKSVKVLAKSRGILKVCYVTSVKCSRQQRETTEYVPKSWVKEAV
jgi:hypothetical protein